VPPQEKIRLYNKLKRQSKKVENHLRDASDGIKNAVATLRSVKSLEDIKNMTIYHEQLDYIFKATLEAIDALLDMKKALADFAKKYTVLPDNSPF
jgi:Xaa-Pro aminopeptidase